MFKKEYKMKKKNNKKKRSRSSLTKNNKKNLSFGPIGCNDVASIQIYQNDVKLM